MATRSIEQEMINYLDKKLENHGLAQHAIEAKLPRLLFQCAAEACVGIREKGGNNKGPLVELIQKTLGGADQEPWCMSFMQTCIAYAEFHTNIKSLFPATEHCMTAWNTCPQSLKVKEFPAPGAIVIWRHGQTSSGHTGMFKDGNHSTFHAIEGNTESGLVGGKVERDGGGVYLTTRSMSGSGSMRLVGFLKPF